MAVYTMSAYPKTLELAQGLKVVIRPMVPQDADALLDFFLRVPEEDRFYLKEDVTSPRVIQRWAQDLDYDRALPLLALVDGRIVADGTLHRRRAGARRHIGEVRIVVDPRFRGKGIGSAVLKELILVAREQDLERLVFELVEGVQEAAIKTAQSLGFVRLATLQGHVRDIHGKPHDLVILELPLGKWQEWWET